MNMNKKNRIAITVAIMLAAPGLASADNAKVNGFIDIIYKIQDDPANGTGPNNTNPNIYKFGADGGVGFSSAPAENVTVRMDAKLNLGLGSTTTDNFGDTVALDGNGANIEQAFVTWGLLKGITVLGGVFNNPIGQDAEDAPNMNFTSHTAVYHILDNQTALIGNNLAGVTAAGTVDQTNLTFGFLNDLAHANEKNSMLFLMSGAPLKNLKMELGYLTQYTGAGNMWDLNGTYGIGGFTLGLDYLSPNNIVNSAYNVWGGYDFGNGIGAKLRYDSVSWASDAKLEDVTSFTYYVSYQAAKNLAIALETSNGYNRNLDAAATRSAAITGIGDGYVVTLELIGTF